MSENNNSLSDRRGVNLAVITRQPGARSSPVLQQSPPRCYICYELDDQLSVGPCNCGMHVHTMCLINFIITSIRENRDNPFKCSVCGGEYNREIIVRVNRILNQSQNQNRHNPRNRIMLERNNHMQIIQLTQRNELLYQQNERLAREVNEIINKLKFSKLHLYYLGVKSMLVLGIIISLWHKMYLIYDEIGYLETYMVFLSVYYLIVFLEKLYKILVNRK
jgi:hypothetical protein